MSYEYARGTVPTVGWRQNAPMIFRRFLKNIYAKWIQFITFTAGLGSL